MRMIKGFLLAISGLFIMITVVSLLIPSQVLVSRGVEMNTTAEKVFFEISNLRNWRHWHPVFKNDSFRPTFSSDSSGLNSFCQWEENGRKYKLIVIALREQEITLALQRPGESDVNNTISLLPLAGGNRVQVEWKALTKLKWYPWEKFYGIFIEKFTGQGYDDALHELKNYIEGIRKEN